MAYFEIIYSIKKRRYRIVLEAENRLNAMKKFQKQQLGVLKKIKETNEPLGLRFEKLKQKYSNPIKNKRVNTEAYVAVLRQLAVMLNAGMPINISFDEAIKSTEDKMLKAILENINSDVESGQSVSNALKPYSRQLGNLTISMFHLGEQTGTLAESILKLSEILQKMHDNRVKLKKATRYPIFTVVAMMIAFGVVITFVVPQFQDIFAQSDTALPMPTQFLLWIEYALNHYGPYIGVSAVVLFVFYKYMYNKSQRVALEADRLILKVYIVGIVTRYAMLGRFVYIFEVLVNSGIPLIEALRAATSVVDNKYIKQQFEKIAKAIEGGNSLYEGFNESAMFESMVLQMLKAGEDSGALTQMLRKITDYYNDKYDNIIDNVSSMIEPILIAAIAGFVLVLALGIFLPMWSLADAAGM